MESSLSKSTTFPLSNQHFSKNPYTGLNNYPLDSPFSFHIPLHLSLDPQERNYIDNIWANNRNPHFPKILTSFSDYLHHKNLKMQLHEPSLKPKSLDAFLELQQTNLILSGEILDLKPQLEQITKKYEQEKTEKNLLKEKWEEEMKNKEQGFEKFPPQISILQNEIMKIVYQDKHQQLVQMVKFLEKMATSPL